MGNCTCCRPEQAVGKALSPIRHGRQWRSGSSGRYERLALPAEAWHGQISAAE